jgi:hypothetical protein
MGEVLTALVDFGEKLVWLVPESGRLLLPVRLPSRTDPHFGPALEATGPFSFSTSARQPSSMIGIQVRRSSHHPQ